MNGALVAVFLCASFAAAQEAAPPSTSIVISVAEQKLIVLRDGAWWRKYPISTSKFGVGDSYGSYKTPVGKLRVCEKIGEELAPGSVIKERHATGEVLPANAPGRDPIVTRVIWLDGLEEQNHNARSRGIYIHGTTEESKIGKPVSYGCIRMRSKDVQEVFEETTIDTPVEIIPDKFPRYARYTPPKPQAIALVQIKPPPSATKPALAKPAPATPLPAIASMTTTTISPKKIAAATPAPAPVALYRPPPVDRTPHGTVTSTEISTSAMSRAMQGSILSAGLPDGPKIPTLPEPPAPKDVPRFGRMAPNISPEKGLSLQNPDVDLAPVIQAAEINADTRAAADRQQQQDAAAADATDKQQGSPIAFRNGQTDPKNKQ